MKLAHEREQAVVEGIDPNSIQIKKPILPKTWRKLRETKRGVRILMGNCTTNSSSRHCQCFNIPLYERLYVWVRNHERGADMVFCPYSEGFTDQSRSAKMRGDMKMDFVDD
jgi:hypothetical protein